MTPLRRPLTGRLFAAVRTGVLAGLVVAGLIYPVAALAGFGTDKVVKTIEADTLEIAPSAQVTRVYAADGKTLVTQFYDEYRRTIAIAEMSPAMQQAIVASEDARFYDHHGVDLKGVARAMVANQQAGAVSQGASTLTMQYVRNVLRDSAKTPTEVQAATEQTASRKLREMRLAKNLEERMSKAEILERYLNVAYFGHRAYGVHAAAEVYFSKRAADLTVAESAMLAGLVQAPSAYDPVTFPEAATGRRNYVIERMRDLTYVTPEVAAAAIATPITLKLSEPPNSCVGVPAAHNDWGFFCDMFTSWWESQPAFGASPAERLERLRRGGYHVVLSLNPAAQAASMANVLAKEPAGSPYALGVVAVEPRTGRVPVMAVNRVYSLDQSRNAESSDPTRRGKVKGSYPNTVNPLLGGGDMPGYQAGSTFKLFVMLAALEQGLPLNTWINSPYKLKSAYPSGPGEPASCGNRWCPANASKSMTGRQSVWSGFGKSVNTYWVQLEQMIGAEKAVRMAERLGLRWRTDIDQLQASPERANGWGSFTLGVADTTPLEMANAYATVAGDGLYCEPLPVHSIADLDGKPVTSTGADGAAVEVAAPRCRQEISPEVARGAADAARCVTGYGAAAGSCGGWSTAPEVYGIIKRPIAGKTGTTDSNRAAWFVGMTPGLAAASFTADPDYPFHAVGGWNSSKPIRLVAEVLRDGLSGAPILNFTAPGPQTVGAGSGSGSGWQRRR